MSGDINQNIRDVARASEPDRYLAALLSPRAVRDDLIALAAFAGELGRIPTQVREPMPGEIRVQWWRDAVHAGVTGTKSGNPIADAFAETVQRHDLPLARIGDMLDAHAHALYSAPPADDAALRLELDLNEGTLFWLAVKILGAKDTEFTRTLIENAAHAYGLARLGLNLPHSLARGRVPLPQSYVPSADEPSDTWRPAIAKLCRDSRTDMAKVKMHFSQASPALQAALLPLALVEPYLKALEKAAHDPVRDLAEIAPLTRLWRLSFAHWRGRM